MPTYDYRCNACGHEFEEFQSITAPVLRKCPKCGKPKLERLIGTGAGVIFKGGGFYETDYRSDSYKKAAEAEKKPADSGGDTKKDGAKPEPKASSDATKGAGKSESKPEPKPKPATKRRKS
jgi:putative FmdB family regulatory protein